MRRASIKGVRLERHTCSPKNAGQNPQNVQSMIAVGVLRFHHRSIGACVRTVTYFMTLLSVTDLALVDDNSLLRKENTVSFHIILSKNQQPSHSDAETVATEFHVGLDGVRCHAFKRINLLDPRLSLVKKAKRGERHFSTK